MDRLSGRKGNPVVEKESNGGSPTNINYHLYYLHWNKLVPTERWFPVGLFIRTSDNEDWVRRPWSASGDHIKGTCQTSLGRR